jgi:hypothetical protein
MTLWRTDPGTPFREVNETLAGRDAELLLAEGQVLRWWDVQLSENLTTGVPVAGLPSLGSGTGRPEVETSRVAQITVTSRQKGFLEGAGIGALVYGLIGLVTPWTELENDFGSRAGVTLYMGLAGGLTGGIIGAIRSSRTKILIR